MASQQGGEYGVVGKDAVDGIEGVGGEGVFAMPRACPAGQSVGAVPGELALSGLMDAGVQGSHVAQAEVDALTGQWVDDVGGIADQHDPPAVLGVGKLAFEREGGAL